MSACATAKWLEMGRTPWSSLKMAAAEHSSEAMMAVSGGWLIALSRKYMRKEIKGIIRRRSMIGP